MGTLNTRLQSLLVDKRDADKEIILSFFNDEISLKKEDYDSDVEYSESICQVASVLTSYSPFDIINILKSSFQRKEVETWDIPQYSDLSTAIYETPLQLSKMDNEGISYLEMGRLLWHTPRLKGADTKYGENHAKTASLIGLTSVSKGSIKLTDFGKIFLSMNPAQQALLVPILWLKVPLFYNYYSSGQRERILSEDMKVLSESTQKRRMSNVRTILGIIKKGFYFQETTAKVENELNSTSICKQNLPLQQIYFGAPGTGKSHTINKMCKRFEHYRTTFHPDTDYAAFVGAYKPITSEEPVFHTIQTKDGAEAIPVINSETNQPVTVKKITYSYVPQPFLQAYMAAWREQANEKPKAVFLVIEEINRGNCAQIFGDIFQLLDRNDNGFSDYPIVADADLEKELKKRFEGLTITNKDGINAQYEGKDVVADVLSGKKLLLPNNLYIWATMNTSDQSLFPIDSAFKRRWDWKYIKIADGDKNYKIKVNGSKYDWWTFVQEINEHIGADTSQEDKKLGYFFVKTNTKDGDDLIITADKFLSKVIFFIYNDVYKDFGFDDAIFLGADGKSLEFADYFDEEGNADEEKIEQFIMNLGLSPINKIDSEEEEANPQLSDEATGRKSLKLSVQFEDGTNIEGAMRQTYFDALKKISEKFDPDTLANTINSLGYTRQGGKSLPMVKEKYSPLDSAYAYASEKIGEYWVLLGMDNATKILEKLAEKLGLTLSAKSWKE